MNDDEVRGTAFIAIHFFTSRSALDAAPPEYRPLSTRSPATTQFSSRSGLPAVSLAAFPAE
jgi:hypothetical protein